MKKILLNTPSFLVEVPQHIKGPGYGDFLFKLMRISAGQILLIALTMGVSIAGEGFSQEILNRKVSLELTSSTLKDVLTCLETQARVKFVYSATALELGEQVTLDVLDEKLGDVLDRLLEPRSIKYVVKNKVHIVLKPARGREGEAAFESTRNRDRQSNLVEVTGTVTNMTTNEPLPGVNVLIKGTTIGTFTDANGKFNIAVPNEGDVLVFSFVGYITQEILVGGKSEINLEMAVDVQSLEEVVVTAFGIGKEKKALSYSVQEVEGERLSAVGNTNLVNSLQGKVAGVTVTQSSGAPGSTHAITIRGSRSLLGSNEPLYVVDGLPVFSGSRTIDINPNDIKSINVLKGPTAAALYGLRSSNGVIVIETKKGQGIIDGKPTISFETNYNFDQISMLPDMQTTYMQGEHGKFNPYSSFSWGPRIDTMGTYINQLGEEEVAAVYDNPGEFFQTGGTLNSNLSISNAFERGNYALSLGLTDQTGIIENSSMERMNVKFAGGYDLAENFKISTSINYANNLVNRIPSGPSSDWWGFINAPPSYDLAGKPIHKPGNPYQQINFRGQHDNLYWMVKNNYSDDRTSRTFGNINLNYKPLDWVSVNYMFGLDEYTNNVKTVLEKGSGPGRTDPPSGGTIRNFMGLHRQINSNLNITLDRNFGEDLNLEFMAGNEFYDIRSRNVSNVGNDIVIGGFHHISNTAVQTTSENLSQSRVVGFFGSLSVSWQNSIFLTATGRNDIVSNMPRQNRSFFYPSLGTAIVFSEFLSIPDQILTFGKFRASVAEVGQAGPLHSTETVFSSGSATGGFSWPYQGFNAFTQSNQLNASDLRTENTRTLELGMDLRLFKNRVGLDYTYYDSRAQGQIYRVPIAISTGFSSELRNAGEMSVRGHEIMLNVTPVQSSAFQWNLITNFSTYVNKVVRLAEGIQQLELGGDFWVTAVAEEGKEFPSIRGSGYARDPQTGEIVVDSRQTLPNGSVNNSYGMPLRSTQEIILGSAQPDFEVGIINTLSHKNVSLTVQIDWRQGGKVSSGMNRLAGLYGTLSESENREEGFVIPAKKGYYQEGQLVVGGANDIPIRQNYYYAFNQFNIHESRVYDATFLRLREIKLSWDLPQFWMDKSFVRSVSFYLVGRNIWTKAALPNFDPEMFDSNKGINYLTYPQIKSYGGGVRVNF